MKRLSFLIASSLLILLAVGAQSGWADLSTGLVAYYPFNGNANDLSGNHRDGTVYGATLTTDRSGTANSAYSFDGYDDSVTVANTGGAFSLTQWTVSAWCLPQTSLSSGTSGPVLWKTSYDDYNYDTFGLAWISADQWLLKLERASDDEDVTIYSASYAPGVWHMVTGTYDGQNLSIYVDGELDATRHVGEVIAYMGPAPLMIGNNLNTNHGGRGVFDGPLDEVYIYSKALSGDEVHDLYVVPLPPALILGSIGLGFAGLRLMRRAEERYGRGA